MDTDSFVLCCTEGNVSNKYTDLEKLDTPIKTNNKVPGKFNLEFGIRKMEEFIILKPKTYSSKNGTAKEKGVIKENKGKHEHY